MSRLDPDDFRVQPGRRVDLNRWPTSAQTRESDQSLRERFAAVSRRLVKLQDLLYAQGKHRLLVVLQAMDTAGKDSTIRHVFGPVNPQGVSVISFKAPSAEELAHDFLWRIHRHVPGAGRIAVFNRSHYEDVLAVRVRKLAPRMVWEKRYEHINAFEKMLTDEGVSIVKIFLHISRAYQKERLLRRLERPDKQWKFNPADLEDRQRWGDYQRAYEAVLERCSTPWAPWHALPAQDRPARDVLAATLLVRTLESLKLKYPRPAFNPSSIVIR